jgi:hypothetical protein
MIFDYNDYRKKINSILVEEPNFEISIENFCKKMSEENYFIKGINDDVIKDVSILIDFNPILQWLRTAIKCNGNITKSNLTMFEDHNIRIFERYPFFEDAYYDSHYYYDTNSMRLFSINSGEKSSYNRNPEYENSDSPFSRYVELIDSKDKSIVELPKLNTVDLYLLKYHAVLKYIDTLDDEQSAKEFKDWELQSYGFLQSKLDNFSEFIEDRHPDNKKYMQIRFCLFQRFLNNINFWFLNALKENHQLDLRSLLTEIKTSHYYIFPTSPTVGDSKNIMEDDDLPF